MICTISSIISTMYFFCVPKVPTVPSRTSFFPLSFYNDMLVLLENTRILETELLIVEYYMLFNFIQPIMQNTC